MKHLEVALIFKEGDIFQPFGNMLKINSCIDTDRV